MLTLSRSYHGGLAPRVMVDQCKAPAGTSQLTDYLVCPCWDWNRQPLDQQASSTSLSYLVARLWASNPSIS
jgi:hypothetical protein